MENKTQNTIEEMVRESIFYPSDVDVEDMVKLCLHEILQRFNSDKTVKYFKEQNHAERE